MLCLRSLWSSLYESSGSSRSHAPQITIAYSLVYWCDARSSSVRSVVFVFVCSPQARLDAYTLSLTRPLALRSIAAIMLEPLQGEGGIVPGNKEYFEVAQKLCDEHGALLICDEVQVGLGRSDTLWGHENLGIEPDVFTSAKALGGGVPIGAMMARGDAANVLTPGTHASTYGGNPLACAAALAVAEYLSEHDVLANVKERGEQLEKGLGDKCAGGS